MDSNIKYEQTYFQFNKIDPAKRYLEFTFYEVDKPEDLSLYLEDGIIIKYEKPSGDPAIVFTHLDAPSKKKTNKKANKIR